MSETLTPNLKTIYLHGALGRKFGKEWKLNVSSVSEAIRAIDINLKGELKRYWTSDGREKKYRVKIGNYAINEKEELCANIGKENEIHIVPVTKGNKSGIGKILAGALLIAAVLIFPATMGAIGGWATVGAMGAALVLGGVMQLITPTPNFNTSSQDERRSTIFEGNSTAIQQGGSVGLVYGRMLVSPMPISISIINSDVVTDSSSPSSTVGKVDYLDLNGGGTQYYDGGVTDVT